MKLRKERIHQCGHTNIDFRTLKDKESIKTYLPWLSSKNFGTMGYSEFKLPINLHKDMLKVTGPINMQRNILKEVPDPKYHKTATFYNFNRIPIKTKSLYTNERVAQLDESFIGRDKFTGDSMMIADITKLRKNKTFNFDDKEKQSKCKFKLT